MPNVEVHGHFAVIVSYASKADWGLRRVGLVEIDPSLIPYKKTWWGEEPNLRIDIRQKAVKKVIYRGRRHVFNHKKGHWCFRRDYKKVQAMALKLERLWPLHILAKEYPKE